MRIRSWGTLGSEDKGSDPSHDAGSWSALRNAFFSPTTGFPAVQVPMGYTRGGVLPAGITFFGRAWSEATLLRLANAYGQATGRRRPPASTPPLR